MWLLVPRRQNWQNKNANTNTKQSVNAKPWTIKLESEENQANPEDDYKFNDQQMKDSANPPAKEMNPTVNPNDKNGDGIPDLVPLLGASK